MTCKFAFSCVKEKEEWEYLNKSVCSVSDKLFPLAVKVIFRENVDRLKRHGYSLKLTSQTNVYEVKRDEKNRKP